MESWAFALTQEGLATCVEGSAFHIRTCKTCMTDASIVVGGEYAITKNLLKAGYNVATLMSKYAKVRKTERGSAGSCSCGDFAEL